MQKERKGITRRELLRGMAVGAAGTALVSGGLTTSCAQPQAALQAQATPVEPKQTPVQTSGHIVWTSDKCIGCQRCVEACSMHLTGGMSNQGLSGVMWEADFEYTYDRTPLFCFQCQAPDCYWACPLRDQALYIDPQTGARAINVDNCIGCMKCIEACTFTPSRISYDPERQVALKCNLCSGRADGPACVQVCSEAGGGKALALMTKEERSPWPKLGGPGAIVVPTIVR